MDVNNLIKETIRLREEILKEYFIYSNYQKCNPWYTLNMIEKLKTKNHLKNIPSFKNLIEFKEDFLVDSWTKIYKQIVKKDPLFNDDFQTIYYYSIIKELYQSQLKEGLEKGDLDSQNRLVTGSNIVLNSIVLDTKSFLNFYYAICN